MADPEKSKITNEAKEKTTTEKTQQAVETKYGLSTHATVKLPNTWHALARVDRPTNKNVNPGYAKLGDQNPEKNDKTWAK